MLSEFCILFQLDGVVWVLPTQHLMEIHVCLFCFQGLLRVTVILIPVCIMIFIDQLFRIRAEVTNVKKQVYEESFDDMIGSFDTVHRRAIMRARSKNLFGCLKSQFDLSVQEFRDALSIRYRKHLLNISDCCGSVFSLSHALSCRYNRIRGSFGSDIVHVYMYILVISLLLLLGILSLKLQMVRLL